MSVSEHIFKPSTMITILIVFIFTIMAFVAVFSPEANSSFFEIAKDSIKILCGALAGAVAGEKYVEKEKKKK